MAKRPPVAPSLSPAQQRRVVKKATQRATKQMVNQMAKQQPKPGGAVPTPPVTGGKRAAKPTGAFAVTKVPFRHRDTVVHRSQHLLAPHVLMVKLAAIAELLYYIGRVVHGLALVAIVIAVILGIILWAGVHTKTPKADHLWGTVCVVFSVLWFSWCVLRGLDYTVAAVWLCGGCLLATRWWARHRKPNPEGRRAPIHNPGETLPMAWGKFVASPKGVLPGVPLTDHTKTKHTEQWTVSLPREGIVTVESVYQLLPRMCHALNKNFEDLIWEQHPSLKYAGLLQLVTNSPVKKPVMFDVPRIPNGAVQMGPYADGQSWAEWKVYNNNSMWGGLIIGGTGSGKSRAIDGIVISVRFMGNTLIWVCDGQNGASSPALKNNASWFVRGENFSQMLDTLEGIAAYRQDKLVYDGVPGFTPTPEYPGILVILDEAQLLTRDPKCAQRLEDLVATTRKLGIAFLMASQHSGLEIFGGKERLRSSILEGNCVVLKIKSRIAGQLIPGFELDPTKLPKIPGYGFTVGQEGEEGPSSRTRTAPFRGRWLLMDNEKAKHHSDYSSVEEWFANTTEPDLDAGSARHAGDFYNSRHELAAREHEQLRRRVEGLAALPTPPKPAAPKSNLLGLPAIPVWNPTSPAAELVTTISDVPSGLTEPQQQVYVAVAKGYRTPKDMAGFLSLSVRHVHTSCSELIDLGHLTKQGNGPAVTYSLMTTPEEK